MTNAYNGPNADKVSRENCTSTEVRDPLLPPEDTEIAGECAATLAPPAGVDSGLDDEILIGDVEPPHVVAANGVEKFNAVGELGGGESPSIVITLRRGACGVDSSLSLANPLSNASPPTGVGECGSSSFRRRAHDAGEWAVAPVDVGEAAAHAAASVSSSIVCDSSTKDCSEPVSDDAAIETACCRRSASLPPVAGVCMLLAPLRTGCAVSVTAGVTDELCESSAFTREFVPLVRVVLATGAMLVGKSAGGDKARNALIFSDKRVA
jgi:hypothetical protein